MKNTLALALAAAGLSQVSATNFLNAASYSCPSNTDNQCTDEQSKGLSFSDLDLGTVGSYGGFVWSGYTCQSGFNKRDELGVRTSVSSKCISGNASSDKKSSPSFGCDSKSGVDKTSVGEFHVYPEFDCDLEFHYDMPDGSTCKHRSACSSSGTIVKNSQCGGAKNVTIVYPSQPSKPKPTCSFAVPSISFSCGSASSTKTYSTKTSTSTSKVSTTTHTSSNAVTTSSASQASSTASSSSRASSSTSPVTSTYSQVTATSSTVAESSSTKSETSSSKVESSSVKTESSASQTTSSATEAVSSTSSASVTTSSATEATTFTSVTSYLTTSTVLTTVVSTITSCAETVTNCPAKSTALTTVTVALSTTICPVTETLTLTSKPTEKPTEKPSTVVESSSTAAVASSTSPASPVETLPCPSVVPSCLNTWMFSVGCKDNSDSSCYCPEQDFVNNIFACLYAHGESDEIVAEAVSYFQGICGEYVPQNPAIATGAQTVTTYLTATATAAPSAVYTTIVVDVTTVVPCTTSVGSIISTIVGSSSTVVISTAVTVPQVVFTTATSGASSTGVAIVPGTYTAVPVVGSTTAAVATSTAQTAPYPTGAGSTLITAKPSGTGALKTTTASSSPAFSTAGAAHIGSGLGFLGFAAIAVAAL